MFGPDAGAATLGDLGSRLGPVPVAREPASARRVYRDAAMDRLQAELAGRGRSLYLVLLDPKHPDSFLACAKIRIVPAVSAVYVWRNQVRQ